ncbi:hypothetical protein [Brytella acorum]|uniref:hypothetical protein n=1 Tax=Brytella acorum TaxID=2959299 RepID=UPI0025ADCB66|nr:hypothetical protein [Brytella acorum]MDF3625320.1 hypothetical protein [Brytella acorum]
MLKAGLDDGRVAEQQWFSKQTTFEVGSQNKKTDNHDGQDTRACGASGQRQKTAEKKRNRQQPEGYSREPGATTSFVRMRELCRLCQTVKACRNKNGGRQCRQKQDDHDRLSDSAG